MNHRGEDSRIWILIQDFSFYKKIESPKAIYLENLRLFNKSDEKINERINTIFKTLDQLRIRRKLYIHSNWINTIYHEYCKSRVKFIKKGNGYFRIKSKISLLDIENDIKRIENISGNLVELHEDIFCQ